VHIIKPARKHKYNTKTAQIHKTNTKQTNKRKRLQDKIYKSTGAEPLYSEETQIILLKKSLFSAKSVLKK
jgi:hypothetical protein